MARFAIVNNVKTDHWAIALCEVWTFDVVGNARDGYEVNDRRNAGRNIEVPARMIVSNMPSHPGAKDEYREFSDSSSFEVKGAVASFELSDKDLKELLGVSGSIEVEGDGENYQVSKPNGYPIGEVLITGWKPRDDK